MIHVKIQPKICREIFVYAHGYNSPPPMTWRVLLHPMTDRVKGWCCQPVLLAILMLLTPRTLSVTGCSYMSDAISMGCNGNLTGTLVRNYNFSECQENILKSVLDAGKRSSKLSSPFGELRYQKFAGTFPASNIMWKVTTSDSGSPLNKVSIVVYSSQTSS